MRNKPAPTPSVTITNTPEARAGPARLASSRTIAAFARGRVHFLERAANAHVAGAGAGAAFIRFYTLPVRRASALLPASFRLPVARETVAFR